MKLKLFLGKKFDAIVVDPPWENKSAKRKKGYLYLPEYDLKKIPMNDILAEDGLLIVWVTNKQKYINFVKEHLFPLWNLQLVSHWHWLKVSIKGELVFDLSSSHKKPYEPLLIGKKNSCKMNHITATIPMERIICSIPCNVHSRKPDLDEILKEFLPPDSKCLEMFARNLLPGWTSWGNEVIKYQNTEYFITTPDGKKNNDADG